MYCGTPNGEHWPRRWTYDARVFLTGQDARPRAATLLETLKAQGWSGNALGGAGHRPQRHPRP
jgi:hypothetical protein